VALTVRKLEGIDAGPTEQPPQWTLLWFHAADEDADRFAEALAAALEPNGGWYADFHSESPAATRTYRHVGLARQVAGEPVLRGRGRTRTSCACEL
jgi:hypothetical protein